MNAQEARNQLAEVNLFVVTSEGLSGHIKLVDVPALSAVKTLRELSTAAAGAGMASQAPRQTGDNAPPSACPEHGAAKVKPSEKVPNGLYCSAKGADGKYCRWTWTPSHDEAGRT